MSTRTILLSVHITAIASWLGVDVLQHAMRHRWRKESPEAAGAWARTQFWLHDRYRKAPPAGLSAPQGEPLQA